MVQYLSLPGKSSERNHTGTFCNREVSLDSHESGSHRQVQKDNNLRVERKSEETATLDPPAVARGSLKGAASSAIGKAYRVPKIAGPKDHKQPREPAQ
ncbi:hypothetical protein NQ317_002642 [Molorchus minor]|uniref:Uncharacterized protein n=1 Tax=Molorchus minor TaxID=1323400 RepID=A0ABQ9IXU5_9CUCU|nr:hypothetical protein NQ317_002642 [Molorchus minor]